MKSPIIVCCIAGLFLPLAPVPLRAQPTVAPLPVSAGLGDPLDRAVATPGVAEWSISQAEGEHSNPVITGPSLLTAPADSGRASEPRSCPFRRGMSAVFGALGGALAGWFAYGVQYGWGPADGGDARALRAVYIGGGAILGFVLARRGPDPLLPPECRSSALEVGPAARVMQ